MRILVICPNWVGDAVMATPTLRAIRKQFTHASIVGLMPRAIEQTLRGNPWLDEAWALEDFGSLPRTRWWPVVRRLRRDRFHLAILLPNNTWSASVAFAGGIGRRVGYSRELRGWMLTDRLRADWSLRGYRPVPLIDYYLDIAKHLGSYEVTRAMELFLQPEDVQAADRIWQRRQIGINESVVTLNPGSAFGPAKRWSAEAFASLARLLVDQCRTRVLVLCGPAERSLANEIAAGSERQSHVHALADDEISIGRSKAVIARSTLLVTTDSGPRHFAPAFGVHVVSLFGPTRIEWTETFYAAETRLQKKVPCGPCQQRQCPQGHHRCMKDLTVDEVFLAVREQLERQASNRRVA